MKAHTPPPRFSVLSFRIRLKPLMDNGASGIFGLSHVSVIPTKSALFCWITRSKTSILLDKDLVLERKKSGKR